MIALRPASSKHTRHKPSIACGPRPDLLAFACRENVDTANADGAFGVLVQQPNAGFQLSDIEQWLNETGSL